MRFFGKKIVPQQITLRWFAVTFCDIIAFLEPRQVPVSFQSTPTRQWETKGAEKRKKDKRTKVKGILCPVQL